MGPLADRSALTTARPRARRLGGWALGSATLAAALFASACGGTTSGDADGGPSGGAAGQGGSDAAQDAPLDVSIEADAPEDASIEADAPEDASIEADAKEDAPLDVSVDADAKEDASLDGPDDAQADADAFDDAQAEADAPDDGAADADAPDAPAACVPSCSGGLQCCGGACVNPANDTDNCGQCGAHCPGPEAYCHDGQCTTPPCTAKSCTGTCCGAACCGAGELCCDVYAGPVATVQCSAPSAAGRCPPGCPLCICASPDTPVATPSGARAIADLVVGDLVLSVEQGRVVAVPVVGVRRVPAPHHVVRRVRLEGGATLSISAPHPTADGRTFGDLVAGDRLDGVAIESVEVVPYGFDATYDILPGSSSGAYFADGVLIGSTLAGPAGVAPAPGSGWASTPR